METTKSGFPPEECTDNGIRMFTIVKDGNGNEFKVVNFQNPQMVPNKGTIIIKAIREKLRHTPSANHKMWKDPITGICWGIPMGTHPQTKNIRWQNVEISDMRVFDLSVPQDRNEWAVVSRASYYIGSPNARSSYKPTHKIINRESEAVEKIQTAKGLVEAIKVIDQLSELQIVDMARNIGGIDVRQNAPVLIKGDLMDRVVKNPKEFLEVWFASNRQVFTIFRRCEATGLIHFEAGSGNYMWKKTVALGSTEPSAIDYITKNPALMMAMDTESKARDDKYQAVATDEEKQAFVAPPMPHRDVNMETVRKMEAALDRMAVKEKEMDEILKKAKTAEVIDIDKKMSDYEPVKRESPPISFEQINSGTKLVVDPTYTTSATNAPSYIDNSNKVAELGDGEMRELQNKAKKMGMVHAYITKDPAKIHSWMHAKESENRVRDLEDSIQNTSNEIG